MAMDFSKHGCNMLLTALKNLYLLLPLAPMKPKKQTQQREDDKAAQLFKCKKMEVPAVRQYSCSFFKTMEQNKAGQALMTVLE